MSPLHHGSVLTQRLHWLQQWAQGADGAALLSIAHADVDAVARLGAAALVGQQWPRALKIFAALCALQPESMTHRLHLACVQRAMGQNAALRDSLDLLVDSAHDDDKALVAEALRMRAQLRVAQDDRAGARGDLAAARQLDVSSANAHAVDPR